MTVKALICVAGLASATGAGAQERPQLQTAEFSGQTQHAISATKIIALTVDGQYVYGETIDLGQGNTQRNSTTVAYDSAFLSKNDGLVCGDEFPHFLNTPSSRYWFGLGFSWQCYAEDIIPAAGNEGGTLSSLDMFGVAGNCDAGSGTSCEPLLIIFESWEGFDNFPDLDGSDGFDLQPGPVAGFTAFPASLADNDGDTFVDGFLGGVILNYNNHDSDGDTIVDCYRLSGVSGYDHFFASGLDALSIPLTSNEDLFDGGKPGADGRGDGGIRLLFTRGDGGDQSGPLNGGFYPATKAQAMLWGTVSMHAPGMMCPNANEPGFGVGESDGTIWGEGEDLCLDGLGAWSDGAPSGDESINERYDNTFDIADWYQILPDINSLGLMIRISVNPDLGDSDCCDVNADLLCTPADFSAWIAAFNAGSSRCDINQDTLCTPADFTAWLAAYNASVGGNPQTCVF